MAPLSILVTESVIVAGCMEMIKLFGKEDPDVDGYLCGHTSTVTSFAWLKAGRLLASGSEDCTVGIWSLDDRTCLGLMSGHAGPVSSVRWASNGMLASCSLDWTVRIWDALSQTTLQIHESDDGQQLLDLAWDAHSDQFYVGAKSGKNVIEVLILNVHSGFLERKLGWDYGSGVTLDCSLNGRVVCASGGAREHSGIIRICDPNLDASPFTPRTHQGKLYLAGGQSVSSANSDRPNDGKSSQAPRLTLQISHPNAEEAHFYSPFKGGKSWARAWSGNGLKYASLSSGFSIRRISWGSLRAYSQNIICRFFERQYVPCVLLMG